MSARRRTITLGAALCVVVACAEEPSTAIPLGGGEAQPDLDLGVPHLSSDQFATYETREFSELGAPARVLAEGEAEYPGQEEYRDEEDLAPSIWNARTSAMFVPGSFAVWGSHDYMANKGRVDVTATIRRDGTVIGTRLGTTEETYPFIPWWHTITGFVEIATDVDCGLAGDGSSDHAAWWEVAPGAGPSVYGASRMSTSSGIAYQRACEPGVIPTTNTGGGGSGGGGTDTSDYYCWLYITYDLYTLEVLDIQVLWCGEGG
ncbi:MAG: hypothetical protein FJ207_11970 [Gemmatimonadetes bacterium]|nr:hypothetical protein [Gemmatimonadota bacterium]